MAQPESAAPFTEESTSRFVQTPRWRLHYNEVGEGPAVILLHGTGPGATGWSNFHQNMAALARSHRVIALDFPGWGRSDVFDCSGQSRTTANAEAVRLLMDALELRTAALVGNSMGGAATLEFMATWPERISHAVTMGAGLFAAPNMFAPGGISEGMRVIRDAYKDPSPANFKRLVRVMVFDAAFVSDALAEQRSNAALAQPEHLTNWLKWPMGHPDGPFGGLETLMKGLAHARTPTLLIHGRDDKTVPMETTMRTVGLIPNSRAVILNRCGHWAQVEHAAEFDRLLGGFLETASGL